MKSALIKHGLAALSVLLAIASLASAQLDKLTFKLGPPQLAAMDRKVMAEALARAHVQAGKRQQPGQST